LVIPKTASSMVDEPKLGMLPGVRVLAVADHEALDRRPPGG
jgi:hypothetical protein